MTMRIGLSVPATLCLLGILAPVAAPAAPAAPAALGARLERLEAIAEIQNVMSRHAWYYSAGQHKRELEEIWARKAPDICWGSDEGWWVGGPLLQDYYVDYFDKFRARDLHAFIKQHPEVGNTPDNYGAGTSMMHTNSTPVIEVAGDGQTAKGMWYSIGQVTQTPGGQQTPTYMWERYAVDFIKEDGHWKIWHFFVHTDWSAAPGESWVRSGPPGGGPGGPGGPGAQGGPPPFPGGGQAGESAEAPKPTVRGAGMGAGKPFAPPSEYPRVPVPYRTFSETFSYGPSAK